MEDVNFLEKLATQFGQNASVKNVYGDPVQAGDKTIIPVAQIAYGVGGGYGQGKKKVNMKPQTGSAESAMKDDNTPAGEGAGGGGGVYAKPKGVYEITDKCTRFIPANNFTQLLTGLAIGFLVKGWLYPKRRVK